MWKAMIAGFFIFLVAFMPFSSSIAAPSVTILTEVAEALAAGAKAIADFGESIRALVVSGGATYDFVAARRARARLLDYQARSVDLRLSQQVVVLPAIDRYLAYPSADEWENVRNDVFKLSMTVHDLLEDVKKERSDFVADKTYSDLMATLQGRSSILHKLADLPPP